jgi:hypothetical protein
MLVRIDPAGAAAIAPATSRVFIDQHDTRGAMATLQFLAILRPMTPPPIMEKSQLIMCPCDRVSHSVEHVPQLF